MTCGVYRIFNTVSEKSYVGSSQSIEKRWQAHRSLLRAGSHHSIKLQNSWNKHSEGVFSWEVLGEFPIEVLLEEEKKAVVKFNSYHCGYNSTDRVERGQPHTLEQRKKISNSMKGRKLSIETREKMSQAKKGLPRPEETAIKLRAHLKRVQAGLTPDQKDKHRMKVSQSSKERIWSEESKSKINQGRGTKPCPSCGKFFHVNGLSRHMKVCVPPV